MRDLKLNPQSHDIVLSYHKGTDTDLPTVTYKFGVDNDTLEFVATASELRAIAAWFSKAAMAAKKEGA